MNKKVRKPLPTFVSQASGGKEFGAFFIDALLALGLGLALRFTLGNYVIAPAAGYNEARGSYLALASKSGLYHEAEDGTLQIYSFEGNNEATFDHYQDMESVIWRYFYVQCGQTEGETEFVLDGFYPAHEMGTESYRQELGKFIYQNFYNIYETSSDANPYYTLSDSYAVAPSLKEEVKTRLTSSDEQVRLAVKKDLFEYFMGPSSSEGSVARSSMYGVALTHFTNQPVAKSYSEKGTQAIFIAKIPAVIIPPLLFFVLMPLCLKRGKTIGKLAMHLSIVDGDGYKTGKLNIALRGMMLLIYCNILLLPSSAILSFALLLAMFLFDFLFSLFSKRHQNLHSIVSNTLVIDDKQTEAIFDNEEEALDYAKSHNDGLAKEIREHFQIVENTMDSLSTKRQRVVASETEVLDLSTIGAARREAAAITSFDEYEEKKAAELDAKAKNIAEPLDLGTLQKANEIIENEVEKDTVEQKETAKEKEIEVQADKEEPAENSDPYDDGFVDEK